MKYLLIGDIHLSDRPPSSCTEDYLDDILTILEHTVQLEQDLSVDGVVWSGDIFHHKQASRTSHRTMQRAIDIVQAYNQLWIVPGNHDMAADRFDSIAETQPLGVLYKAGAKLLSGWADDGYCPLYGVPWQQQWTPEAVQQAFQEWSGCKPEVRAKSLVVAHAPLYPPGLELPYEYYPLEDEPGEDGSYGVQDLVDGRQGWASIQEFGFCYYGHVHEAHGTYQVGDVIFCNQGAITRGSLHESELNRAIAVTTWSVEEGFKRIDVPHKPADKVFRLMEKREREESEVQLTQFLDQVGAATIEITSIESVLAHIRTLDLPDDIVRLAEELLIQSHG